MAAKAVELGRECKAWRMGRCATVNCRLPHVTERDKCCAARHDKEKGWRPGGAHMNRCVYSIATCPYSEHRDI